MTDRKDNIKVSKITFDDNNQEKNHGRVWNKSVTDLWLSFCADFLSI